MNTMDMHSSAMRDSSAHALARHKRPLFLSLVSLAVFATGFVMAAPIKTPMQFPHVGFTDVSDNHPYSEAVSYLAHNNVYGYPDRTFKPDSFINRAEFVHLITGPMFLKRHGKNGCTLQYASGMNEGFFSDVPLDAWYADDVCIAQTRGIANGHPDGTFRPAEYITFAEASKMLVSLFAGNIRTHYPFSDGWYHSYVKRIAYLHAVPLSVRKVDQKVTRGEVAEMIFRLQRHDQSRPSLAYADLVDEDVELAGAIPSQPAETFSPTATAVTRREVMPPLRRRTAEMKVLDQRAFSQKKRVQIHEAHRVVDEL